MATLLGGNGKELLTDAERLRLEKRDKREQRRHEKKQDGEEEGKHGPLHRLTHMFKK